MTDSSANKKPLRLSEMHSGFNRFVIVDGRNQPAIRLDAIDALLAGCQAAEDGRAFDQLLYFDEKSESADCRVLIYNADASAAGMCANGLRCVASLMPDRPTPKLQAANGGLFGLTLEVSGKVYSARRIDGLFAVNIGRPATAWNKIPLAKPMSTPVFARSEPVLDYSCQGYSNPVAVNVGNPHLVFFLDGEAMNGSDLAAVGPKIETDPLFPERTNVSFVKILNDRTVVASVWERGTGQTKSCGSAACAIAWAANFLGLAGKSITVIFGPESHVQASVLEDGSVESAAEAVLVKQYLYSNPPPPPARSLRL